VADASPQAWLELSLVPGLGPAQLRKLLAALGSPRSALDASAATLARVIDHDLAAAIKRGPDPGQLARAIEWANAPGHHLLTRDHERYPVLLHEIPDPPAVLYASGRLECLTGPALAVVGSRSPSAQGARNAHDFARALAEAGLCIVSGLAVGIDAAAHRGALAGSGSSIAVLGTGIDIVYPRTNHELAATLARDGLLLSEFPLSTPPIPANFPRRNRLIAALARGCLVVEAALASGSLITARLAADQGREVFAIPGSIHSPVAKGCHRLIKQGAKLVECAEDVLEELGGYVRRDPARTHASAPTGDSEAHRRILDAMGHDPVDIDTLAQASGLAVAVISATLLELELAGRVAPMPGGRYQRLD